MRLSTSTNLLCERPDGSIYPLEKTLYMCSRAGFDMFDMSFYEWSYPGMPFLTEQWEKWIHGIAQFADEQGLAFHQGHAYTYNFLNPKAVSTREYEEMLVRRSLKCCAILGTKVVVVHPGYDPQDGSAHTIVWERNKQHLEHWLQYADSLGMEIAVENMYQYSGHRDNPFFSDPLEIKQYLEDFKDHRLGACWDFEHGTILGQDQPQALRILGKHLKATHVSDTVSDTYEPFMHVMPFTGTTQWKPIVKALKEVGYQGVFSLEAHNFAKKVPEELVSAAMQYAWEIGQYLIHCHET